MNIIEIIDKKRLKKELNYDEINYAFMGYLNGDIESYQMSALLMAIVLNGMSDEEVYHLTDVFINSGDILDLSKINGVIVDKHSTGGIGDKTTLIIAPIVASLGVKVCKMSGRGLGYTGGTIDKLESIPGFNVNLTDEEIIKEVNTIGMAITSQTKNLTPLDKVVYALRDVTGTVESIPLIASSIMSKKIASGASKILIDIKVGEGALIKTKEDALKLSELMKNIGNHYNREVRTLITDMDRPLGRTVGNLLEVVEAASILKGYGKDTYLYKVCIDIASNMVSMALNTPIDDSITLVEKVISNGEAYRKFLEFIKYQGGRLEDAALSKKTRVIKSDRMGEIKEINALKIGMLSASLGSSKFSVDDQIDYGVGVVLNKKVGDVVKFGDPLCTIYIGDKEDYPNPLDAFTIE
ncbi:MAG: thymidine phosphorylase [Bacilli bacterium]|nr:thymidine phosphorylase [Bacilli bacterium]